MKILRRFLALSAVLLGSALPFADAAAQYVTETRTLIVGEVTRTYLLARPDPMPATALPLVISMHGDGGNSAGMRGSLPLETAATNAGGKAVFAYPKSKDGAFEYWSGTGRRMKASSCSSSSPPCMARSAPTAAGSTWSDSVAARPWPTRSAAASGAA